MKLAVLKKIVVCAALLLCVLFAGCRQAGPWQATGIKIGEVTDSSAIVWTRLTRHRYRSSQPLMPEVKYYDAETGEPVKGGKRSGVVPKVTFPAGSSIQTIEGSAPGTTGEVRVRYKKAKSVLWRNTGWHPVDPDRDYTRQFELTDLKPGTEYDIRVYGRNGPLPGKEVSRGRFVTAPEPNEPDRVVFTVSTGQAYGDRDSNEGYKIYGQMLAKVKPSFFVHTGDIIYYDRLAKTIELARWHWHRMYSLPSNVNFHKNVASYFIKDDHDTLMNDCWPGMDSGYMGEFTFEQGLGVFREQAPMGERTWRTFRWGKDLQIWLVEGRDYRSPNTMEDGPEKTIWGAEQKAWFKKTVAESDATFRILISPTPVVGPDRENKHDNHSNAEFSHEGNEIRQFLSTQERTYVICGDRHWQYVSVDPETGVREYSCGPASDKHAGGWSNDMKRPQHRYLNVVGGFLSVTVERIDGRPTIIFLHYSTDGEVLHEEHFSAEQQGGGVPTAG